MNAAVTSDDRLLLSLQQGLPIVSRPFAQIGRDLGLAEADVLSRLHDLFESGVARRFGAVFDSRSLGYESTLCAVDIPQSDLVSAAARIAPHPGITHCYEREGHPNLWFTLTAPAKDLESELVRVGKALGPYPVLNLPALQKFKIEAVFGHEPRTAKTEIPAKTGAENDGRKLISLTTREQQVVRYLQSSISVTEDPFGEVARQTGYSSNELLELLGRWMENGIIRRIALIVRHHKMGFSANSMCVWKVAPGEIAATGRGMALSPHVTHCYERPATPVFPFNLYAMIHARSHDEALTIFENLGKEARLSGGQMMWSVREFKKSSPVFFCEPPRAGILFAAPGSSSPDAQGVFDRISKAAGLRFPGIGIRWAFTSSGVRRKLEKQGHPVDDPRQALLSMQADGFTRVAVVSLHLSDGMEYGELVEAVDEWNRGKGGLVVTLGTALLADPDSWCAALKALLAGLQGIRSADDAVVLVAHGSLEPGAGATFDRAISECRRIDPRLFLGMMLGVPSLEQIVAQCKAEGVRKVFLLPCMVAAGFSAKNDIAGDGGASWKSGLERAGFDCVPIVKGFGDYDAILELWMNQAGHLLNSLVAT